MIMNLDKKKVERQLREAEESMRLIQKQENEAKQIEQEKKNRHDRELRNYQILVSAYHINENSSIRFMEMILWLQKHPNRIEVVPDKNGVPIHKQVSYEELGKRFSITRLLRFLDALDEKGKLIPDYSE